MGLFLRTCHQICHLSPSARFRQQINHPSVWPAVPFRCLPPLPAQPARSRLEGNPPEPSPVPRRLPCRSAPARQRLPPHPPCGGSRGGGGRGAAGLPAEPFPKAEDALPPADGRRGAARLCGGRPPPWLGARTAADDAKDPRQQGTKSAPPPRFGIKSRSSSTLRLPRHER